MEQLSQTEYTLTVHADKEFLEAESTVYPVTVDPTVTITPTTSYIDDATLSATNTTTNYGSSTTMFVGGTNKGYIAMRFYALRSNSVFTSLAANQILSVDLNLYCGSKQTSAAIYAKQYKPTETSSQYWTETGITYAANGVVTEGTGHSATITATGRHSIPITNIVKGWKSNSKYLDYGLLLSMTTMNSSYYYSFYSSEMYESSLLPSLTIEYINYAYYCQNNPSLSSPSFSTSNLDILFYKTNSGVSNKSWLEKINDAGCVICSMAMILRTLEATTTTTKYDVRTNTSYVLQADPFTATLANTNFPSITYSSTDGIYIANTTQNPVLTYYDRIATAFGRSVTIYNLSGTDEDKANDIAYFLSLNPEGVAVTFRDPDNNAHTIVFTNTTYELPTTYTPPTDISTSNLYSTGFIESSMVTSESIANWENAMINKTVSVRAATFDNLFTVSDPVSTSRYSGNQVLFSDSYTASEYEFGDAEKIIIIN